MKLKEIAERLGLQLEGDGDTDIHQVAAIEDAGPGDLTFFTNPKYHAELRATRASAVILGLDVPAAPCAMLRDAEPYLVAMRRVVPLRTDVDVTLATGECDDARLDEIGARYRLAGPIARLRAAGQMTRDS